MNSTFHRPLFFVFTATALALIMEACSGIVDRSSGEPASGFDMMPYNDDAVLGADEVRLSKVLEIPDVPLVLNFWAADCPPCRAEKPRTRFISSHGNVQKPVDGQISERLPQEMRNALLQELDRREAATFCARSVTHHARVSECR